MATYVFVYGTLKADFPNFHINRGTRLPGEFVTVERFPLYIIGASHVPWLVNQPGGGYQVTGQVFEVDEPTLANMDVLEQVDEPLWYCRCEILVRPSGVEVTGAPPMRAWVYFGSADRLSQTVVHAGPLAEYTAAQAANYDPELD